MCKIVEVLPEEDRIMMNNSCQINIICLVTGVKVFGKISEDYNILGLVLTVYLVQQKQMRTSPGLTWVKKQTKTNVLEVWSFCSNSAFEIAVLQFRFHEFMRCMWILDLFRAHIQVVNLPQWTQDDFFKQDFLASQRPVPSFFSSFCESWFKSNKRREGLCGSVEAIYSENSSYCQVT